MGFEINTFKHTQYFVCRFVVFAVHILQISGGLKVDLWRIVKGHALQEIVGDLDNFVGAGLAVKVSLLKEVGHLLHLGGDVGVGPLKVL